MFGYEKRKEGRKASRREVADRDRDRDREGGGRGGVR